jgi:hypothetical protein
MRSERLNIPDSSAPRVHGSLLNLSCRKRDQTLGSAKTTIAEKISFTSWPLNLSLPRHNRLSN